MARAHAMADSKSLDSGKYLLGKTAREITSIMGEPFAYYTFHDEEVYLYESGKISTIAFRNGFVVICDELAETRRTTRVQPSETVPVLLNRDRNVRGALKDISIAGAAIQHSQADGYSIGNRVEISFALHIGGISRYFQIPCRVHDSRHSAGEQYSIFLFDLTQCPWKKKLLSRYVQLRSTLTELGLHNEFPLHV